MNQIDHDTVRLIEELLPFGILLNAKREIIGLGQSLRRRYPELTVGRSFSEFFDVLNPRATEAILTPPEAGAAPRFLVVRLREVGLRLRGGIRSIGSTSILLELAPAISSEKELDESGLSYEDLPLHDNTLDLLISLRAHRDALHQRKLLTEELDNQNAAIALTHSELMQRLEQERVATRFRNRVLGMLSHEFRTSLAQIMSVGELLRRGVKSDQANVLQKHGATLVRATAQIVEAFEGLSRFAKSEGAEAHHYEDIDLAHVIGEAAQRIEQYDLAGTQIQIVRPCQ